MNEFAVGLSEHPDAAVAAGEAFGAVLDGVGRAPDVAVLFLSVDHVEKVVDLVDAVHAIVAPRLLIGAAASTVIGDHREVEDAPAVVLWAMRSAPSAIASHLRVADAVAGVDGASLVGITPELAQPGMLIALGDPFSFPAPAVFDVFADLAPSTVVVGGMASAGLRPDENRLIIGREVVTTGAATVLLPFPSAGAFEPTAMVSQGCRPVGSPFIVTDGAGNRIDGLGGRSPLERLRELFDQADETEATLLRAGVHIGKVIDESMVEFGPGDFLVRGITGIDNSTGAIFISDGVRVGETAQFHVRDASTASAELRSLSARPARAALMFNCNGRGTHLFDVVNHDASVVQDGVGPLALAGMACAGEFGPIGGRNFIHTYTASVALFRPVAE